ncbi:hypothetical protein WJX73_009235 [Symbiochloris irregularis]|uniref:DNA replication complex GINS protein PSF2 n=1 Tax=Symbiochloris irregularis TaxID=706552 RepID=A0AAW1PJ91_9CHLO
MAATQALFSSYELEFFAEDETISIVPNFTLPGCSDNTLECIGGAYGPFLPNRPVDVPLWMAMALHQRKKCRILPPAWMDIESLKMVEELERDRSDAFQPLPFHYLEIAHMLFTHAKDTFGGNFYKVHDLVESVRKVRMTKIHSGLKSLAGPMTVKLNNLSAMECNLMRGLFQGALDRFWKLAQLQAAPDAGEFETQATSSPPSGPRRQFRT